MRRALVLLFLLLASPAWAQQATITSVQVANNTTAVKITDTPGKVVGVDGFSIDTSTTWVKLYDATSGATTCGSGTPKARYFIPGATNGGTPLASFPALPDTYTTGITLCVTTGYADSDTTAPAASKFVVNIHWQ